MITQTDRPTTTSAASQIHTVKVAVIANIFDDRTIGRKNASCLVKCATFPSDVSRRWAGKTIQQPHPSNDCVLLHRKSLVIPIPESGDHSYFLYTVIYNILYGIIFINIYVYGFIVCCKNRYLFWLQHEKNDVYIVYSCQHCPLWKIHLKCWNIFTRVYSVNVYIKKPLQ